MSKLAITVTKQDHLQGHFNAPCSLVKYGDYECPACAKVEPTIRSLQDRFGDRLSLVFRNFPLGEIHPWAEPAAEVAEYAGRHGRYWEMHNLLFANQDRFNDITLRNLLEDLKLNPSDQQLARSIEASRKRISGDLEGGIRSGVNGTPTFFLNGERYDGKTDYESFAALLELVLVSDGE